MVVEFTYNGKLRQVRVEKETSEYIQGENYIGSNRKYSTYTKSKIQGQIFVISVG